MIYLDHSATHLIPAEVLSIYLRLLREENFNPAARYAPARKLRTAIDRAKKEIMELLAARQAELIFTSGASESINLCLKGMAEAYPHRPKRIITSELEHAATREALAELARRGYEITVIESKHGKPDPKSLEKALERPALALSLIHVQNEFGGVLELKNLASLAKSIQPQIKIHIDAVQSIGRIPFSFSELKIDAASFSGHKFGSPKGIGYLLFDQKLLLNAQIHGGGHQNNLRSGTENYPLVGASLAALRLAVSDLEAKTQRVTELRDFFINELRAQNIEFKQIEQAGAVVPHILSLEFPGLRAEALMTALSEEEIYVSIGSACSSNKIEEMGSYAAYGLSQDAAKHLLRFSINAENTEAELRQCASSIAAILAQFKV
ncbi:MAG: cysteine desulfurase family protein [Eubacteriales bacterium]|nr:cysteine desulfurase family protein [Eubacteriales bacterium]